MKNFILGAFSGVAVFVMVGAISTPAQTLLLNVDPATGEKLSNFQRMYATEAECKKDAPLYSKNGVFFTCVAPKFSK